MKKLIIGLSIILITIFGTSSCNNTGKQGEFQKIKTAAAAREHAAKELVQGAPDTVFLDYHWGMTKTEVNNLTRKYCKEKKLSNYWVYSIRYDMTLEKIGTIETDVSFGYYKDTLSSITISTYDDRVTVLDLLYDFSQTFLDKGYSMYNEDEEPISHQPAIEFFKGNTSITLVMDQITTKMCFKNEYYFRLAKEEIEEEKQKEINALKEQAAKTKNDF